LAYFAELIKRDLHKDIKDIPGAGAAGGLGASLIAFLNAELKPGIDIVIEIVKLERAIKDADLVITGEGKIDSQTIYGKAPIGVAKIAKRYNVPVIAIAAIVGEDASIVHQYGISTLISITETPMRLDESLPNKVSLIKNSIKRSMMAIKTGKELKNHYLCSPKFIRKLSYSKEFFRLS